jgi:hypothetical protein
MKMYTEKDVNEAVKVLFFEGAGCVERGDVENCRIRTAFTNDEGKQIYLELMGFERNKEKYMPYEVVGYVDYCHYAENIGKEGYTEYENVPEVKRGTNFEYSKTGILQFVNETLHCSFDEIKITDIFDGYRVHKDGGYNFMEDFIYNPVKAEKARLAFDKIDKEIRAKLCEKYSKISLQSIEDDSITVRCYASDVSMEAHGMDSKQRVFTVKF